jgi:hypothetical protein
MSRRTCRRLKFAFSLKGRLPASRAGLPAVTLVEALDICASCRWLLMVLVTLGWAENDLALPVPTGDGQRLQDNVEPVAGLVGEGRTNGEPKVILAFATLDDGVGTI